MKKSLGVLAVVLLSAVACNGASQSATTGSVITIWTNPVAVNLPGHEAQSTNPGDWLKFIASEYTKLHPNVTFTVQTFEGGEEFQAKLRAAVQAGSPPDILDWTDTQNSTYAWEPGVLEDLSTLVPAETLNSLKPAYRTAVTLGGSMYLMPSVGSFYGFLKANKAIFDAAGVTLPSNGEWTYDEFEQAIAKVAIPDKRWPIVIRMTDQFSEYDWQGFMFGEGCQPYSADLKKSAINSPQCAKGLQWVVDAGKKGWIVPGITTIDWDPQETLYWQGQVAISYGRITSKIREEEARTQGKITEPVDTVLVQFPHAVDVSPVGMSVGFDGWSVFKQSDPAKAQVIGDFIGFAFQPQYSEPFANAQQSASMYTTWNLTTLTNPLAAQVDGWVDKYGILDQGVITPHFPDQRALRNPIYQGAYLGKISVADALREIDAKTNELLLATP
ncbi:MAG: ABC transporter substrate-binding protein [Mycobacterium sp.]